MRYYTKIHKNTCGVDLHSNNSYLCLIDETGEKLIHKRIKNDEKELDRELEKYKEDLVIIVESTYNWYWLGEYCQKRGIKFLIGHAQYIKAIDGDKKKNDRVDSEKLAKLARAQLIPEAYANIGNNRYTRDILRRRLYYVRLRAALKGHVKIVAQQYNYKLEGLVGTSSRNHQSILSCFLNETVREEVACDLISVVSLSAIIKRLEKYAVKQVEKQYTKNYELLQTIPGVGPIIAMTLLYEMDGIKRFKRCQDFMSYARLVKCKRTTSQKVVGKSCGKIGNPYLKWAFSELAVHIIKNEKVAVYHELLKLKYGKAGAWSRLSKKSARTVYYMLKTQKPFSLKYFLQDSKIALESGRSLEPSTKEVAMVID